MSMLFILSENNTLFFLVKLIVSKIYWLLTIYLKKKNYWLLMKAFAYLEESNSLDYLSAVKKIP